MSSSDNGQAETSETMFTIADHDSNIHGPLEPEVVRDWISRGRISGDTWVRKSGDENWRRLDFFPQFLADLCPGGKNDPPLSHSPGTHSSLPVQETNGTAIAGMVLGILSILSLYPVLGFPCNIAGIITSSIALKQIKRNPGQGGRGMAIAGLVCSIISTLIALLVLAAVLALIFGNFH